MSSIGIFSKIKFYGFETIMSQGNALIEAMRTRM